MAETSTPLAALLHGLPVKAPINAMGVGRFTGQWLFLLRPLKINRAMEEQRFENISLIRSGDVPLS